MPPSRLILTGSELPQAKKDLRLCTWVLFGCVQLFVTLWTVACQASLSGGGSPGKNTGAYWPTLVALPSRALYFLLPQLPTPLSTWCCQNPCNPSSCTTSTPGLHRGKSKSFREASGANPVDDPHAEVEIKPQLKPRGSVEEDPKPSHQLYQLQIKYT